jgi:hypothetical protein
MKNPLLCASLILSIVCGCAEEESVGLGSGEAACLPAFSYAGALQRPYIAGKQEDLAWILKCGVGRGISVAIRGDVESLEGFADVESMQSLIVEGARLRSLKGLENMTSLVTLELVDTQLSEVNLPNLQRLSVLVVSNNSSLRSIKLEAASTRRIHVSSNPVLTEISVPAQLPHRYSDALDVVRLTDNPNLKQFTLGEIEELTGLVIENSGLTDLTGFASLEAIRGSTFQIRRNVHLESLAGLEKLEAFGVVPMIEDNPELRSLAALAKVTNYDAELRAPELSIRRNPQLPACEVEQLRLRLGGTCNCSGNDSTAVCEP